MYAVEKMKNNKYRNAGTVLKSNRKLVEIENKWTYYRYRRLIVTLGTGISIKKCRCSTLFKLN